MTNTKSKVGDFPANFQVLVKSEANKMLNSEGELFKESVDSCVHVQEHHTRIFSRKFPSEPSLPLTLLMFRVALADDVNTALPSNAL